jgi:hypothetical protein
MEGTIVHAGERFDRPFHFDLDVRAPSVLGLAGTVVGEAVGTLRIDDFAKDVPAHGRLELSPLLRHRIRYTLEFTANDGKNYRFDGSKDTSMRRRLAGWTTLPGKVYGPEDDVWGEAVLRFSMRRDLRRLLRSVRAGPTALASA